MRVGWWVDRWTQDSPGEGRIGRLHALRSTTVRLAQYERYNNAIMFNSPFLTTSVGRMRVISVLEGLSYLLLLGVAMPLKYLAGVHELVSVIGMIHGLLFVVYAFAALNLWLELRWSPLWFLGAMFASIVPFGTFLIDARLRRHQRGPIEV